MSARTIGGGRAKEHIRLLAPLIWIAEQHLPITRSVLLARETAAGS